jgi:hypothetical protein
MRLLAKSAMSITCIAFLALGLAQKLRVIDASELVQQYPVCLRAAPAKGHNKGLVLDVLWGSQFHKGDTFQIAEPREYPGTGTWFPKPLSQDSIVFMKSGAELKVTRRWEPTDYRIDISRNQVKCHISPIYPVGKEKLKYQLSMANTTSAPIRFRVDVPRKSKLQMTYPEVKAELLRLRSKVRHW